MAYYINDDCIACGVCADTCPHGAPYESGDKYEINPDLCKDASECVDVCPSGAIKKVE